MTIEQQLENYKNGFPYLKVISAATPQRGILVLNEEDKKAALDACNGFKGSIVKFVPASGAASRMFKDLFEAKDALEGGAEVAADSPAGRFLANVERFPFYCPEKFEGKGPKEVLEVVLTEKGLNYGAKPKGQLLFHSYPQEVRTAFEEHLVEGAMYAKTQGSDVVKMHFTVSPEHMDGFVALLDSVKAKYEHILFCFSSLLLHQTGHFRGVVRCFGRFLHQKSRFRGRFLFFGQPVKQLRHPARKVASCELRYVRVLHGQVAFQVLLPAVLYESADRLPVFPVKYGPGPGLIENHRHGSVRLTYSEHRPH